MVEATRLKDGRELVIRGIEVQDAEKMIDFLKQVHQETEYLLRTPDELQITIEKEKEIIKNFNTDDNHFFIAGEVDGRIVATLNILQDSRKKFKHTAEFGVSVLKEFWGLGIGSAMLKRMFEWAKNRGVEKINLEVFSENKRAIELYKHFGFEEEGRKKKQIKINGKYQDIILMTKFI